MPESIIDGVGKGYRAQVTEENRLSTDSRSRPSEEIDAKDFQAFIVSGECHTAAAASGGLMYITNDYSDKDIVITRIYIDSHVITPTDLIVTQVKQPATKINGTDISTSTSQGIIQKNFISGELLSATVVISDGSSDMTYTGGQRYHSFAANNMSSIQRDMKGTNVISPTTTLLFGWKTVGGGNATNGEIISLSVNLFIRDKN